MATAAMPTGSTFIDESGRSLALGKLGRSTSFVRPAYVDLEANRVHPAGPLVHPDPSFRPIGVNNWAEILHDYTLLRYLSNSNIKEIKDHVSVLGDAVDPKNPNVAILIDQGPYNTNDARAVWKYCDAYVKRRGQERNNKAARRSRARKEAETLHWKRVALAAGAPDQDFTFDGTDPAHADDGDGGEGILPRETAAAITAMKATWAVAGPNVGYAGIPGQMPLPSLPPGTVAGQSVAPSHVPRQTMEEIYQIVYGVTDPFQAMPQASQQPAGQAPLPALACPQTRSNSGRPAAAQSQAFMAPQSPTTAALTASVPSVSVASAVDQTQYEDGGQGGSKDDNADWDALLDSYM